ncbi:MULTISPECIES: HlyU family transcriptional regulator [Halocynthiibacter]|uniref:HlyU family transcriptional regulator n=1 Tax=Halocynthiibacter halioticoli TaxID=2986804 RepID=A0AAE3IVT4_9RHOB|nr:MULTISPECIES: HlyU family transcriptional regulator [Halocynthiibacter]MCV6822978.1 HlyU family transcriptional regulator [Halocynthiibacter halioticoli]MCW4055979.1 HlyU family transcriptional regulator [Halocynthiibacter sp. SDUM655004]
MSLFSKLFGGGEKPEPKPVEYKGFDIFPDLMAEGGKYRLSARIEKTVDGERKTCAVIRADVFDSKDQAESISIDKAKQVIDEQGDRIFD